MKWNREWWVLWFASWLVAAQGWAQVSDARIEQARIRTGPVGLRPETVAETVTVQQGRAIGTPGDLDMGVQLIVKPKERPHPWRLFASTADYYTDNVALTKSGRQGDGYFFSEIGVRYERKLSESLSIEATVRQGFFRYHEFSALDFNSLNAGVGLYYDWKDLWGITVFGRYNFEMLTDEGLSHQLFRNHTLSVGLQKTFAWQGSNFFYIGYTSIFGFAEPPANERNEHSLYAGAQVRLSRRLDADLYARLVLFDYVNQRGRMDLNQTIVAALTYHITERFDLNASVSLVFDRSNRSQFDYNAVTTGGGLAFKYQF